MLQYKLYNIIMIKQLSNRLSVFQTLKGTIILDLSILFYYKIIINIIGPTRKWKDRGRFGIIFTASPILFHEMQTKSIWKKYLREKFFCIDISLNIKYIFFRHFLFFTFTTLKPFENLGNRVFSWIVFFSSNIFININI